MLENTRLIWMLVVLTGILGCARSSSEGVEQPAQGPRFVVTVPEAAMSELSRLGLQTPLQGRVYVIVSRNDEREPRLQIRVNGVPFWGKYVSTVAAEEDIVLSDGDEELIGFPLERFSDLPAGDYRVQAFFSVYTTFARADGHTVSMHLNSGAGQNPWRAPGNIHSTVRTVKLDPDRSEAIRLVLDTVIPPLESLSEGDVLQQGNPVDTGQVRFVKIKSDLLSAFWGQPMYIGANVLLPKGYDTEDAGPYPVMYMQGHFPGRRAPFRFEEGQPGQGRSEGFSSYWMSDEAPRMIAVTFRDANPYYDTSYSVNSANLGPYGDAIMEELIPYLEQEFNVIPESWARVVAGGSTGGWEALALQIFYPDAFGGAWGWCPDPVDFNYYQIVNIYEDENAYYMDNEWHRIERPNARRFDGNIVSTIRQENYMERAIGTKSRSGGQWAIWEAVFGPTGEDGYPKRIWDPVTGEIDGTTAEYWQEQYDLHAYLRANWDSIGSRLTGKLHIAVGDMDTYYLDNAVYLIDEFLGTVENPPAHAEVSYGRRKPHCWIGESPVRPGEDMSYAEFVRIVADYMRSHAPPGASLRWYR